MDEGPAWSARLTDSDPSAMSLLYKTLVHDGARPGGLQTEFESLSVAIDGSSAQKERRAAHTTQFDTALFLHERSGQLRQKQREEKAVADQLVLADTVKPCRYRGKVLASPVPGAVSQEGRRGVGTKPLDSRACRPPQSNAETDGPIPTGSARKSDHRRRSQSKHAQAQSP